MMMTVMTRISIGALSLAGRSSQIHDQGHSHSNKGIFPSTEEQTGSEEVKK